MREALDGLKKEVLDALQAKRLENVARVGMDPRGVVLTIDNGYLFAPGDAEIRGNARWLLCRVAAVFAEMPVEIRIEGHTDDIPMSGGHYADNWELSTARATSVLRTFIHESHISPRNLSASGYGEFRPVASNATAEGRSRNRRVELVISPLASQGHTVFFETDPRPPRIPTAPVGAPAGPDATQATPSGREGA
jgi:chemotaxis protein MotB